ncbi:LacI family DNA-binding transcriptional regulator [Streptomyces sp. NPDC058576]|uniref:LacI family DNA-binding transcriptional regulator n=1 Tax=Streptomyces sp. NPDC058576 TaxID=3346547 RepID=UPI0036617053
MATLQDVATAAGVSKSVASRVLNNDSAARVAPQTRARVIKAAQHLRYVPDHRARALRSLRSGAIALVVPDVTNAVFAELHAGVQSALAPVGMTVLLCQLPADSRLSDIVGQGRVDGVLLQRREDHDDDTLTGILDTELPVVLFNSTLGARVGSVVLDDADAARVATAHLLSLGHRRIGFLGGTEHHDAARRRAAGYRHTMREAGLRVDADWTVAAGWEADAGERGVDALLAARRPPTAIVTASVNAALGAVSHAVRRQVAVPGELSVVAIQDTWFARVANPSVTVVQLPLRAAGAVAADMLLDHLGGAPLTDRVVDEPAPRLVPRESTAPVTR